MALLLLATAVVVLGVRPGPFLELARKAAAELMTPRLGPKEMKELLALVLALSSGAVGGLLVAVLPAAGAVSAT